jgi:hypothetical protein
MIPTNPAEVLAMASASEAAFWSLTPKMKCPVARSLDNEITRRIAGILIDFGQWQIATGEQRSNHKDTKTRSKPPTGS